MKRLLPILALFLIAATTQPAPPMPIERLIASIPASLKPTMRETEGDRERRNDWLMSHAAGKSFRFDCIVTGSDAKRLSGNNPTMHFYGACAFKDDYAGVKIYTGDTVTIIGSLSEIMVQPETTALTMVWHFKMVDCVVSRVTPAVTAKN